MFCNIFLSSPWFFGFRAVGHPCARYCAK
jgi:hypothetical protein